MDNEGEPSQPTTSRLGLCEVCNKNDSKYTCPRCEVKTCCLNCTLIHKKELNCNGQRDKTKFIPLNQFTNLDLASDYRFLEEIGRSVDAAKRLKLYRRYKYTKKQIRFMKEVEKRDVHFKYLPEKFLRHKNNTSYYNFKEDMIYWHLELIFVHTELKLMVETVPETKRLSDVLSKYMVKQESENMQEKLQFYQAADIPGIKLLLKAEKRKGNKFYELDPTLTLREVFKNKTILEYPIIHVILKDHSNLYDILDSDDEDEDVTVTVSESKKNIHGSRVIDKIIKKSEKEHPLKNLLFGGTEFSDNDDDGDDDNEREVDDVVLGDIYY